MYGSMAKYEYINGERRYYRGVPIWYDLTGDCGSHWYIEVTYSIASGISRKHRHYFQTLVMARQEIDGYYRETESRLPQR